MDIEMYRCIGDVFHKREANVVFWSVGKRRFVRSKAYRGSKTGCRFQKLMVSQLTMLRERTGLHKEGSPDVPTKADLVEVFLFPFLRLFIQFRG